MIQEGNKGVGVVAWQRALIDVGHPVEPDGVFGRKTRRATQEFQLTHDCIPDGVVGPHTYWQMANCPVVSIERFDAATRACGLGKWRPPGNNLRTSCSPTMVIAKVLAQYIAQLAHESGSWVYITEVWGPTSQQKRYEPVTGLSKWLGNTEKGDGKRFRGRGLIMLTGRGNYAAFDAGSESLAEEGILLENDPDMAAVPWIALRTARWFWDARDLSRIALPATEEAFKAVTKGINGGYTGLQARRSKWARAEAALGIA